jgi:DNA-binding NarL/FixJ family response regulator
MPHRILLVDDHEIVRQGLKALIDSHDDLEVVGEGGTVEDAIKRTGFDSPDMVLLDVRLPDGSGVEACREIRQRFPDVRVLMLTSFADEDALIAAIMAGASGYVLKRIRGDELIDSIRRVCAGESLLDPDMVGRLFDRLRTGGSTDPLLEKLSDQERKILGYIAEGMTNRQIAAEMFLAEKTVKNYVSNMLTKMGMSRRTEAAAYMARLEAERDEPPETWADGSLEPN